MSITSQGFLLTIESLYMYQPPTTFDAFLQRYPDAIRGLAGYLLRMTDYNQDAIADLEQELFLAMLQKRTIERFDPALYNVPVTEPLFFQFIKMALTRHYHTLHKSSQAASRRVNGETVSLMQEDKSGKLVELDISDNSHATDATEAAVELQQLRAYIERHDSKGKLLAVLDSLAEGKTMREVAEELGLSHQLVYSRLKRIRALAKRK